MKSSLAVVVVIAFSAVGVLGDYLLKAIGALVLLVRFA